MFSFWLIVLGVIAVICGVIWRLIHVRDRVIVAAVAEAIWEKLRTRAQALVPYRLRNWIAFSCGAGFLLYLLAVLCYALWLSETGRLTISERMASWGQSASPMALVNFGGVVYSPWLFIAGLLMGHFGWMTATGKRQRQGGDDGRGGSEPGSA